MRPCVSPPYRKEGWRLVAFPSNMWRSNLRNQCSWLGNTLPSTNLQLILNTAVVSLFTVYSRVGYSISELSCQVFVSRPFSISGWRGAGASGWPP